MLNIYKSFINIVSKKQTVPQKGQYKCKLVCTN